MEKKENCVESPLPHNKNKKPNSCLGGRWKRWKKRIRRIKKGIHKIRKIN